jgi:DNA polymerase-4
MQFGTVARMPSRRIAHLDMDAFYASVELLRYPELSGLPVVIGGRTAHQPTMDPEGRRVFSRLRDYVGRGVITTSTYEARALGVFSAMPTMQAARLAPEAILLPADFERYRHYSRLFKDAVRAITPAIEDRGIDEIYIDLGSDVGDGRSIASALKQAVSQATGLSCSIGVAPNKLLAKLCSDLEKPDGLTILNAPDIPARIWPLAVGKVNGIGPKATEKLNGLGIHTVGDLANASITYLQQHFSPAYSEWLHAAAHGIDDRPVVTHSEPKSISRETTFERDLHVRHDRERLSEIFTNLCARLGDDLARKGYVGRTIGIKLRFANFETVTRDSTLPVPTANPAVIRRAAGECLKRVPFTHRIRLLGVRIGSLSRNHDPTQESGIQGELWLDH